MKTKLIVVSLIVLVCVGVCLGFLVYMLRAKYTATSYLRVQRSEPFIVFPPAHRDSENEFEDYKETQRELAKSRFVLMAALRKPEVAKLPSVQAAQQNGDAVRWLERFVTIEFRGRAEIMSVSVTRGDPQEAATLARAVVDAYLNEVVNAERDQKRQRLSELDRAYADKENSLRAKLEDINELENELARIGEKKPYPQSIGIELLRAEIEGLKKVLDEVRLERERARIEIRGTPRVTLLQRAEAPETEDW